MKQCAKCGEYAIEKSFHLYPWEYECAKCGQKYDDHLAFHYPAVTPEGFEVKDSGKRMEWATGSMRDTNEGKPRFDLVSVHGLKRLAEHMMKGANKYGERNWEKGQATSRSYDSALRHLLQWQYDDSEDHLAAVAFNVFNIIHVQEQIKRGVLPEDLDDFERMLPEVQEAVLKAIVTGIERGVVPPEVNKDALP